MIWNRYAIGLTVFFLILNISCEKGQEPEIPSNLETREMLRLSAHKICNKMIQCYRPIYRTASPDLRAQITLENCESTALSHLEENSSMHTAAMRASASACFNELLELSCDDFIRQSFWNPSCLQLRKEVLAITSDKKVAHNGSNR